MTRLRYFLADLARRVWPQLPAEPHDILPISGVDAAYLDARYINGLPIDGSALVFEGESIMRPDCGRRYDR